MNRYPLWKYLVIAVALLIGFLYALPNIFGEAPAVQISAAKPTLKVDLTTQSRIENILTEGKIKNTGLFFERTGNIGSIKIRFENTDTQLKARDLINQKLNVDPKEPNFIVALNLLSNTPHWLGSIN
ncbi:MAG: protein translocase subunit SecD, partial [Burkholderiaceae bacterium]|nr:protein translocase subunit SecD [Burkholderiaceae bacterium]